MTDENDESAVTEQVVTLDDFSTSEADTGDIEQFISDEEPDHDPFTSYPAASAQQLPVDAVALFSIPMEAAARLAHNLDVRRQKIWACWGKTVSVGWIGNAAHQATCTDHNKDSTGVVHAIDPMVTGTRAKAVVDQCLAHRDDLQYVIHNRVIWSASRGWEPRKYTGSNPHTDHVHVSGKHGSSGRSNATCTGYDRAAEAKTPVFDICPAPKPPAPKPPVVKPPVVKKGDPGTRMLEVEKKQMTGNDVLFVQRFIGKSKCGAADGKYGPHTAAGVRWYQDDQDIRVDGKVGPQTWKKMGVKWRG